MNLRLSSTWVERHRLYRSTDFISEEDLDSTIKGEFKPTRPVILGGALDKVLESPETYYHEGQDVHVDGVVLPADVVKECLAAVDLSGLPQPKATKEYELGPDRVTVVAKADRIRGLRIAEYKTRWGSFDVDSYRESAQPKLYLDVFGASAVDFTVFCMSEYESGEIALRSIEQFSEYPYPWLHNDCAALVRGLVEYVHARGLEAFCQPKPEGA